jgi:cyclophilin family peptidyl-prolyl cis-trans isomerase/protein-disulfide isomerase
MKAWRRIDSTPMPPTDRLRRSPDNPVVERHTHRRLPAAWLWLAIASALLAACAGATPAPATEAKAHPTLALPGPSSTPDSPLPGATSAAAPTPAPTLPPVTEADWSRGPMDAPLQLVVYTDFQCPSCRQLAEAMSELQRLHPGELRQIYRPFPLLPLHDKASLAGQAAEAAGDLGAFWEMHDLLFSRAEDWADLSPEAFTKWLEGASLELGLDRQIFMDSLTSGQYEPRMRGAFTVAVASGLTATPTLFLNGRQITMPPTVENLEASLRVAGLESAGLPVGPPPGLAADTAWQARLQTSEGDVVLALLPESAPLAVSSFIYLAKEGWYDGTIFHRVVPGILVEGGDPTWTGLAGPAYHFENEIDPSLSLGEVGMVALVSEGPGTNGGSFFINLEPLPGLDGQFTLFGRVVEGLEILHDLPGRDPLQDLLRVPPLIVERVVIEAANG